MGWGKEHKQWLERCCYWLLVCRYGGGVYGLATLQLCDDGSGLPAGHRDGVGLPAMRQRAEKLGGRRRRALLVLRRAYGD